MILTPLLQQIPGFRNPSSCTRRVDQAGAYLLVITSLTGTMPACVSNRAVRAPEQIVHAIIDADNARDLDAAVDCYTADVIWISPDGNLIAGDRAIRERYRRMYADYDVRLSAIVEEVESAAMLAFVRGLTVGELSPRTGGDPVRVRDRFVAILRRAGGRWKVARLMWAPAK